MSEFERDDQVTGLFTDIGEFVAGQLQPAGVDAVFSTVRKRRRNRVVAAGILAAAMLGGPAAGLALAADRDDRPAPSTERTSTPTPAPSASPSPEVITPSVSAPPSAPNGRISSNDLKNATITLSPWTEGSQCASGRVKFTNGKGAVHSQEEIASRLVGSPVYADVDHDGAEETAIVVMCVPQWADYKVMVLDRDRKGRIITFGQVVATVVPIGKDGVDIKKVWGIKAAPGGQISVDVGDYSPCCSISPELPQHQWRTYGWNGERFRQTGGPTAFGPNPNMTDLALSADDLTLTAKGDGTYQGILTVTVHNHGDFRAPAMALDLTAGFGVTASVAGRDCRFDTYLEDNSASLNCTLGSLAAGQTMTVPIRVTATARLSVSASMNVNATDGDGRGLLDTDNANNSAKIKIKAA